jgi:hypothetical protein
MNTISGDVMIVVTEAKAAADKHDDLDQKIEAAMTVAKNHWMVLDENKQFQGAIGGILLSVDEETQERINAEMASLNILSAMMTGVPVDLEQVKVPENPIGLMKRWKELK